MRSKTDLTLGNNSTELSLSLDDNNWEIQLHDHDSNRLALLKGHGVKDLFLDLQRLADFCRVHIDR